MTPDEKQKRIHSITYSTQDRAELAERMVGLEDELAKWERLTAGIELPEYPIAQFQPKDLERENDELRERMELLTESLRNDHDIDASWDGLRHFWSIELTEGGCLMRDRTCKAEAENAKLRKLVLKNWYITLSERVALCQYKCDEAYISSLDEEIGNAKAKMRELGLEVDA